MAESDPLINFDTVRTPPSPVTFGLRVKRLGLMLSVPLLLIGGATVYYFVNLRYISTENAYVAQDKISVASQVSGDVVEVAVSENQMVKAGDLLFRLDPAPFRIALAQANAALAAAQVKIIGMRTDLAATDADISGASKGVAFYEAEYQRQSALMANGFTTRARFQQAQHDLDDARTRLANMQNAAAKAQAALATSSIAPGTNPAVLAAQAQKARAELDLARATVRAPVSGKVSQTGRLQIGSYVMAGLPVVTLVGSSQSRVDANFKETELANMRIGQPAKLTFDAYPGLEVAGHVASIGACTGSEFSMLPAQNATGNWVKVTQRVPVRIAIDGHPARELIAGLSTNVRIDTGR